MSQRNTQILLGLLVATLCVFGYLIPFLEERGARAAILVTADGACLATTATIPWLVAA